MLCVQTTWIHVHQRARSGLKRAGEDSGSAFRDSGTETPKRKRASDKWNAESPVREGGKARKASNIKTARNLQNRYRIRFIDHSASRSSVLSEFLEIALHDRSYNSLMQLHLGKRSPYENLGVFYLHPLL